MFGFIKVALEKRRVEKLQAEIWRTYYREIKRATEEYADAKIDKNDPEIYCYDILRERAQKKRVLALEAAGLSQIFPTSPKVQRMIFKR